MDAGTATKLLVQLFLFIECVGGPDGFEVCIRSLTESIVRGRESCHYQQAFAKGMLGELELRFQQHIGILLFEYIRNKIALCSLQPRLADMEGTKRPFHGGLCLLLHRHLSNHRILVHSVSHFDSGSGLLQCRTGGDEHKAARERNE